LLPPTPQPLNSPPEFGVSLCIMRGSDIRLVMARDCLQTGKAAVCPRQRKPCVLRQTHALDTSAFYTPRSSFFPVVGLISGRAIEPGA
jgi:hypothetical protein